MERSPALTQEKRMEERSAALAQRKQIEERSAGKTHRTGACGKCGMRCQRRRGQRREVATKQGMNNKRHKKPKLAREMPYAHPNNYVALQEKTMQLLSVRKIWKELEQTHKKAERA